MKKNKKPCGPIFSEEQKIALMKGFQKQNIYATVAEYAKANNVSKSTFRDWSVRYGVPLRDHPRKVSPKEQRIALLEGFHKQNTYIRIADYAKANNVNTNTLRGWSLRCGIPLGWHHTNHRKPLPKEQKIALLYGFQKQNTYTTIAEYAKANNVSRPALCKWAEVYGIPLGRHYTKKIQKTPNGSHSESSAA